MDKSFAFFYFTVLSFFTDFSVGEIKVENQSVLQTLVTLPKTWSLSVDIKPLGTKYSTEFTWILYVSHGKNNDINYHRLPEIWYRKSTGTLRISASSRKVKIGEKVKTYNTYINTKKALPLKAFTTIKIEHVFNGAFYVHSIYENGMQ